MKILHIVGGPSTGGAFKGAAILHDALLELKIDSKILNDMPRGHNENKFQKKDNKLVLINNSFFNKLINIFFVIIEKFLKVTFLHSPRSTFTFGFLGFDITKLQEYKEADLIHIHWLNQGFIGMKSISKMDKPIIWTMRDMWPFTGGAHYTMDFKKYEKSFLAQIIKRYKKKFFQNNIQFVAISDWLKAKAEKSYVLKGQEIKRIYNNVNLKDFKNISRSNARRALQVSTKKIVILYGAQNPQSKRKGWNLFVQSLKKLDTSKYFLIIFGSFWSHEVLNEIGIEYRSLGFVDDKKKLNKIYSCADLFVASSIQEAFGKTWLEALACGIPVVCFKRTSISEIIDHKTCGYVVENFNSNELKKGIDWLSLEIKKKNFKKKLRNKISKLDAPYIAKKYINLYKSTLKNK
mgnify:CR=1 FL=1